MVSGNDSAVNRRATVDLLNFNRNITSVMMNEVIKYLQSNSRAADE